MRTLPSLEKSKTELKRVAQSMPKAELHVHIEGTLSPELMFELALKNSITLPYPNIEALKKAYAFSDLQSFLDIYYAGASVLQTENDFYSMAWAYLQGAVKANVVHAEIFFDPQTHTARGIPIATVIAGLSKACSQAPRIGINAELILCFLRHLSESDAIACLHAALPYREHFIGVGLDSSERDFPPEGFKRVFKLAREQGLRVVAHAGEEGPPSYIWSAINDLLAERIDHGVAAMHDPELLKYLAATQIPLTVCPLSNLKLRGVSSMAEHPILKLLDAGLCITVNSDDPAYFGGDINANFDALIDSLPIKLEHLNQFAKHSINASFVDPKRKNLLLQSIDTYFAKIET